MNPKIPSPASATHCRPCLALGLGPQVVSLLLLLLPGTLWAEGLALELPTAPVHLAAASADSVEARVDLSDPNKFPFSSTAKWKGYLEFLGKPGTERSIGQPDLFLPLIQDKNDLTFFNLRGQLQFDDTDVHEYNIGLGHRHMFQEWILGGYGYYDKRHTQLGNSYNQFTGGMELMSVDWAFRANGYLPENKTETILSGANATVIRPGDQIKVQIDGIVQEKALPGVDGEVGYLLPIPWRAYRAVFDETRVYAGGYHFFGEDNFESVTGPRGRVEWRAYDLPILGPGSRFMMGVEAQWDEPRGSQAFGLASLRIPFDVFSDKSKRKALTGLDRRMLQPVIRDVDIVTSEVETTEITAALNRNEQAYTKAVDIHTAGKTSDEVKAEIEDLQELYPDETIAVFTHGDSNDVQDIGNGDFRDMVDTGALSLGENHTLSSAGKELRLDYVSRTLGAGTIGYTPDGTPVGLAGSITMGSGSQVNAMWIDATGHQSGILAKGQGNYYVTNSIIQNATIGVLVQNKSAMHIWNSQISDAILDGIQVTTNAALTLKESDIFGNGRYGVFALVSSLTISKSRIFENLNSGIHFQTGSSLILTGSQIYDNLNGVFGTGSISGMIYDSQINNNKGTGVSIDTSSTLDISKSGVSNNIYHGLLAGATGKITAENVTITGNGIYGVVSAGGDITITNSVVSGHTKGDYKNIENGSKIDTIVFSPSCTTVTSQGSLTVDGTGVLATTGSCFK